MLSGMEDCGRLATVESELREGYLLLMSEAAPLTLPSWILVFGALRQCLLIPTIRQFGRGPKSSYCYISTVLIATSGPNCLPSEASRFV
jgi:hypothetical protein